MGASVVGTIVMAAIGRWIAQEPSRDAGEQDGWVGDPGLVFRQDLAVPYGSAVQIAKLDNFSNVVYTTLFEQTMLTTPGGTNWLRRGRRDDRQPCAGARRHRCARIPVRHLDEAGNGG